MIPFGPISAAAGLVWLIVQRWRRYAFAAVVSPIAFGGCSIVGLFTVILLVDVLGITTLLGLDRAVDSVSWRVIAVGAIAYVTQESAVRLSRRQSPIACSAGGSVDGCG
jgi:hypothetical protein